MRSLHVLIVTTTVIVAATAATAAGVTAAAGQTVPIPLTLKINSGRVVAGHPVAVTGRAPATDAGKAVVLESAPPAGAPWRDVATTRIGRRGGFRFRMVPRTSALVRAVEPPVATAHVASAAAVASSGAATSPSPPIPLEVAARFAVRPHQYAVLGRGGIRVAGMLTPATVGRRVRLQSRAGGAWRTVAAVRTGRKGRFALRYRPAAAPGRRLRVLFGGDTANGWTTKPAGTVSVFYPDVASWYDDAGNTACGFHAGLGVANRTLPCGTHVAFHYGGRTVTAVVDDRGPYVGGRDWDLNQTTASALGFAGAGGLWVSR